MKCINLILFLAFLQINCTDVESGKKGIKRKCCDTITQTFTDRIKRFKKWTSPPEIDTSKFIGSEPYHSGSFFGHYIYCKICSMTLGGLFNYHAYLEAFRDAVTTDNFILAFEIFEYFHGNINGICLFTEVITHTTNIELIKTFVEKYNIDVTNNGFALYHVMSSFLATRNLQFLNVIKFLLEKGQDKIFFKTLETFRYDLAAHYQEFEILEKIYKEFLSERKKIITKHVPVNDLVDIINNYL